MIGGIELALVSLFRDACRQPSRETPMIPPDRIPVYESVTVPCRHRLGCPCPGCPYCGTGAMVGIDHATYRDRRDRVGSEVDDRAFKVEYRGWSN